MLVKPVGSVVNTKTFFFFFMMSRFYRLRKVFGKQVVKGIKSLQSEYLLTVHKHLQILSLRHAPALYNSM